KPSSSPASTLCASSANPPPTSTRPSTRCSAVRAASTRAESRPIRWLEAEGRRRRASDRYQSIGDSYQVLRNEAFVGDGRFSNRHQTNASFRSPDSYGLFPDSFMLPVIDVEVIEPITALRIADADDGGIAVGRVRLLCDVYRATALALRDHDLRVASR